MLIWILFGTYLLAMLVAGTSTNMFLQAHLHCLCCSARLQAAGSVHNCSCKHCVHASVSQPTHLFPHRSASTAFMCSSKSGNWSQWDFYSGTQCQGNSLLIKLEWDLQREQDVVHKFVGQCQLVTTYKWKKLTWNSKLHKANQVLAANSNWLCIQLFHEFSPWYALAVTALRIFSLGSKSNCLAYYYFI